MADLPDCGCHWRNGRSTTTGNSVATVLRPGIVSNLNRSYLGGPSPGPGTSSQQRPLPRYSRAPGRPAASVRDLCSAAYTVRRQSRAGADVAIFSTGLSVGAAGLHRLTGKD